MIASERESEAFDALSEFLCSVGSGDNAAADVKRIVTANENMRNAIRAVAKLVALRISGERRNGPVFETDAPPPNARAGYNHISAHASGYWKFARDDVMHAYDAFLLEKMRAESAATTTAAKAGAPTTLLEYTSAVDPLAFVLNHNAVDPIMPDEHQTPLVTDHAFPRQLVTKIAGGVTSHERYNRYYKALEALGQDRKAFLANVVAMPPPSIHDGIVTGDSIRAFETTRTLSPQLKAARVPTRLLPTVHPLLQRPMTEDDNETPPVLFAKWIAGSKHGRQLVDSEYMFLQSHLSCDVITQTPPQREGAVSCFMDTALLQGATVSKLQPQFPDILSEEMARSHGNENAHVAAGIKIKAAPSVNLPLDSADPDDNHVAIPLQYVLHFLAHTLYSRASFTGNNIDAVIQAANAAGAGGGWRIQTQKAHGWR